MSWKSFLQIDRIEPLRLLESPFISITALGVLRLFLLLIDIYVISLTGILQGGVTYFVYATNWSAILNLWYLYLATILTWRNILGYDSEKDSKFIKLAYISQEVALPASLMVVALYWTAINPRAEFPDAINEVSSIQNHAGSCALVLIDFTFSEMRFIPVHIVLDMIFMLAYLPVNAAYSLTVQPVYSVMTWRAWGTAVFIAAACIAIAVFYVMLWGFSKLKTKTLRSGAIANNLHMVAVQYEMQAARPE